MEVITDPKILQAIEDEDIKRRNLISDEDIVTDPDILAEIEIQSKVKEEEKDQNTFYKKYITGEARTQYPKLPGISEVTILDAEGKPDNTKAILQAIALSITPSIEAQIDMIKKRKERLLFPFRHYTERRRHRPLTLLIFEDRLK